MPAKVKKGEEFEAVAKFNNPLGEELTDCKAGYEGGGFDHVTGVAQKKFVSFPFYLFFKINIAIA